VPPVLLPACDYDNTLLRKYEFCANQLSDKCYNTEEYKRIHTHTFCTIQEKYRIKDHHVMLLSSQEFCEN
jgi:hypothetical protein